MKAIFSSPQIAKSSILVVPEVIQFQDCAENEVYELQVKVINKGRISTRIKYIPPRTYVNIKT